MSAGRFLLTAAAGIALWPAAQAAMTFDDARAIYREKSALFRVDAAEVERARAAAESAKALSGPRVDLIAMHVEGKKEIEIDVPEKIRTVGNGLGAHFSDFHLPQIPSSVGMNYDLGGPRAVLQATWPLYTGGRISAQQDALAHKVREAEALQSERVEEKDAELAQRYWGVQLARSVAQLRESRLADEEAQVSRAKRF